MRLFLDSSALAKRYVEEQGTQRVLRLLAAADEVIVSALCVAELISGFNRLRREGALSSPKYRGLKRQLAADMDAATVMDLTPGVIDRAIRCLEQAPLRSLDAVQLGSALECACDLFLTADRRQRDAATRFRLKVEPIDIPH